MRLLIVPVPAATPEQAAAVPPKQPGAVANVVLTRPRSTKRYSSLTLQLPGKACSTPPPSVHPALTAVLFQLASGQVPTAGGVTVQGGPTGTGTLRPAMVAEP